MVPHQSLKELAQLSDDETVKLWLEQRDLIALPATDVVLHKKLSGALQKFEVFADALQKLIEASTKVRQDQVAIREELLKVNLRLGQITGDMQKATRAEPPTESQPIVNTWHRTVALPPDYD